MVCSERARGTIGTRIGSGKRARLDRPTPASRILAALAFAALAAIAGPARAAESPDSSGAPAAIERLARHGALDRGRLLAWASEEPANGADLVAALVAAFEPARARRAGRATLERSRAEVAGAAGRVAPGIDLDAPVRLATALEACERVARRRGLALAPEADSAYRAGLLAGSDLAALRAGAAPETLSRRQLAQIAGNARFPVVRLIHTTDVHGQLLPRRAPEGRPARGGAALLAAHVLRLRADDPAGAILVDGGDAFQGTLISNLAFGRPVVEQMNALGYAAMAIGNHEFDWGVDTLVRRIDAMAFAALGANLRERGIGRRPRWARADTVVVRHGVRIGLLGLCYRKTAWATLPQHVAGLTFPDDSLTAAREVPSLARRSDLVVVLGHVPADDDSTRGLRGDLARAARGVRGVAAWLGGHSHTRIVERVHGAPLLVSGSHGEVIGVCDLVVDPLERRVLEARAWLEDVDSTRVAPDSATAARVARWNAAVAPLAERQVGLAARRITRVRGGESPIGNLVTDAMRAAVGADIALQNTGGLRAELPAGPVTYGALFEVVPFENTLVTLELTGREVRRAVEEALSDGRVTQVSGIHYRFDLGRPPFDRVLEVTDESGRPLDVERRYRVVINDFMAQGGDRYRVLTRKGEDTAVLLLEALERFVVERCVGGHALEYTVEGRIRREGSTLPER